MALSDPPAELEILATVDEIEVLRLGGAPDPRNCRRNQGSEASRSSRSSELSTKSRFRGLAELQVIENIDDIELRRPRGAPSRAFHADTGARRGALASISEESRSSKSSKTLTKSTFGGFEELQVGNSTRTRERDGGLQPPIERLVYIYIYVCRQLAHVMPPAPALCRRFAAFLICAASTQGSYSDDFAWHDATRWTCYNSKSRAR